MVGWNHWLDGHEFEQASGDSEGLHAVNGMLQSMGSQRVGHDWMTNVFTFAHNVKFTMLTKGDKSEAFSAFTALCRHHLCLVSEPSHTLRRRLQPHELSRHLPQPPHHEPNFCLWSHLFLTFPVNVITHCMCPSVSASYTIAAVCFSNHRKSTPHAQKILEGSRFAKNGEVVPNLSGGIPRLIPGTRHRITFKKCLCFSHDYAFFF